MCLVDFWKICEPLFLHMTSYIGGDRLSIMEDPLILDSGLQKRSCLSANLNDGRHKQHECRYNQHDGRHNTTVDTNLKDGRYKQHVCRYKQHVDRHNTTVDTNNTSVDTNNTTAGTTRR
jgi:hypothetical protein